MTDDEFIKAIAELYYEARKSQFPSANVRRGRSRSISSSAEDLFALYVSNILGGDYRILIDQPISFYVGEKSKTIYPDIVIVKGECIIQMWDLKMDLGWNRKGFVGFCEQKSKLVSRVRGKACKIKDGMTKEREFLTFSQQVNYNITVVSSKNISPQQLKVNKKKTKGLYGVNRFFLTSEVHPNKMAHDIQKLMATILVEEKSFRKMRNQILSIQIPN